MYQASWNGVVLAESDKTVKLEGNQYFPPDSIDRQYFSDSQNQTVCPWKGVASYYSINLGGELNTDAAWYYPEPKETAKNIQERLAFWRGVEVCLGAQDVVMPHVRRKPRESSVQVHSLPIPSG